jgi:hypothetical protein
MKLHNKGERKFIIAGYDLLKGGKREVDIHGVESGIISPGDSVEVTDLKGEFLLKGYQGEFLRMDAPAEPEKPKGKKK